MADAALADLRAVTCECAATASGFSPEQSAEAAALPNVLRAPYATSATAELRLKRRAPQLPQLPAELMVEVFQHLDAQSLSHLACTC